MSKQKQEDVQIVYNEDLNFFFTFANYKRADHSIRVEFQSAKDIYISERIVQYEELDFK